jgi:DNA-binding winged helix-turn-helix (wHTH) protein
MAYRFGKFLYDPVSHRLLRGGTEVPLTHKSRELLLLFLHDPGRLLTRDQIVARVWPEVAVTDDAVRFQIAELRKALGEAGEAFLKTVRREGYRWEAEVQAEASRPVRSVPDAVDRSQAGPRFRLVLEDREVQLLEGENVIGREPDSALWIDDPSVSRRHAGIAVADGQARLEDLGSKNGTYLNGRKIAREENLSDGDEIRIGIASMVLRKMSRLQTTRTEREA